MVDKEYWENVINNLLVKDKASWAAHVLSSNCDKIDEIVANVDKETFIKNCLYCYSVDFTAQPYLDEVLARFSFKDLVSAYKKLNEKPIQTAGALMWLLEDIDPEFKWLLKF